MPALILYLLKVNVALVLFYLAYHFVLRRLTFYALNRCFLLFSIAFSTAYPFMDVSGLMSQHQGLAGTYIGTVPAWAITTEMPEHAPVFNYWQIPVFLFWLGTGIMAIRLLLQFISLYKIHAASEPAGYMGIGFRQVNYITQAFSFWQTIYLNPAQHKEAELESILRHEQVHVKDWHTLDVLLAELNTVFYWFNPGAWLMKKAIKENLEFIADQKVIWAGVDRKAYQYLLLKVVGSPEPQIANQFNFPTLKRRIAMMNKKKSSLMHVARYAVLVPLIAAPILLIACSEEEADIIVVEELDPNEIPTLNVVKGENATRVFGDKAPVVLIRDNLDLEYVHWTRPNTLVVKPKAGREETYQLNDKQSLAEANRKYDVRLIYPNEDKKGQGEAGLPEEHKAFYARNPQVRKIEWVSRNEIRVRLESEEEIYNMEDKKSRAAAEKKYGKFPSGPLAARVTRVVTEENLRSPAGITQNQNRVQTIIPADLEYYQNRNNLPVEYTNFLKKNPDVKKLGWTIHQEKGIQAIIVFPNSGDSETYNFNDANSMATAKSKYGNLPSPLPPPPPVRSNDK